MGQLPQAVYSAESPAVPPTIKEERMKEKILTDNAGEKIVVRWDGTRFTLIKMKKAVFGNKVSDIIFLNPREMLEVVEFASSLGRKQ